MGDLAAKLADGLGSGTHPCGDMTSLKRDTMSATTIKPRRMTAAATAVAVASTLAIAVPGTALAASVEATASIRATGEVVIDEPSTPTAGRVSLTGRASAGGSDTTTVVYVIDATNSTGTAPGSDCSGNGAVGAEDDLNGDGSIGDVLDCEIAGVVALNSSLSASPGVQVGLVAFADQAAAATVDPSTGGLLVAPGATGGEPQTRAATVARSVVRNRIGQYVAKDLGSSGNGTAFNSALETTLATLAGAPAGPKYVMFLSDGRAGVDDALVNRIAQAGVRVRTFGVGKDASCVPTGSLAKLAKATGESCTAVSDPARLASGLTGSRPDGVARVTVSIDNVAVAADLDAVGGWTANFTLGRGIYTATAQAALQSGLTTSARRTFTVAGSATGPAPGTVKPGPGAGKATAVKVTRPEPSRSALPRRVVGKVGALKKGLRTTKKLSGARVSLQARTGPEKPWVTVAKRKVTKNGKFALTWRPKSKMMELRVALADYRAFAGSATTVKQAKISDCRVTKRARGWSVRCLSSVKSGSRARLVMGDRVLDRTKVRKGSFRLDGEGPVSGRVIEVAVGKRLVVRLRL